MSTQLSTSPTPKKSELTIRLERRGIDPMLWNAIGASIFPGAADDSKLMAIDYCKSRGLDIMKKPCHIVPMNVKDAKTGQYSWRDIIMPGIAEIRITADRSGKYAGQDAPIFGPIVEMEFGKTFHSVPEFCTVTVYKIISGQRVSFTHTEFFEEVCNTTKDGNLNSMWTKRKRGQLSKCAEAGALRKAFPEESGGIIAAEEATDEHIKTTTGRIVVSAERIENPYRAADADADLPYPEPTPEPEPRPETAPESPVEALESNERAELVGDIRTALKSAGITMSVFAGKVREAGLVAPGVQVIDAPIEALREILANAGDILAGHYIPLN